MSFFTHAALLLPLALIACARGAGEPASGVQQQSPQVSTFADDDPRCVRYDHEAGACTLYDASIIELLARPAEFHLKRVQVIGFVEIEFEGSGIYLSDDAWARIRRNGLWLDPPSEDLAAPGAFTPQYMIVEGTFDADARGHLGLWSGSIRDVSRFDPYDVDREMPPPYVPPPT